MSGTWDVFAPIGRLVTLNALSARGGRKPVATDLETIENAAMVVDSMTGRILWVGSATDLPMAFRDTMPNDVGRDRLWIPALAECHTHFLFAGSRAADFAKRATGMTYLEVAKAGGGILSTVRATRAASLAELEITGRERLETFARRGVGLIEGKTGYGLTWESELRCLEAMRALSCAGGLPEIVATFLPAHACPPEFADRKDEYVQLICEKWIPDVGRRNLATFVDIFVEEGYFTLAHLEKVAVATKEAGLRLKVHADQFHDTGATKRAVQLGATSVDHADFAPDDAIELLAKSETVAVLLPGASLYAGHAIPRARRLLDAGAIVALSTDFNPGTSPTTNLPLMATLGCTQMKMTVAESIAAITYAPAKALGKERDYGSLSVGKRFAVASFPFGTVETIPSAFGEIQADLIVAAEPDPDHTLTAPKNSSFH